VKIYFDLDDVGNELCRFLFETYNQEHGDSFEWVNSQYFMVAENEGLKVDNDYFVEVLHRQGTFLKLEPAPGYVEVMKKLIKDGHEVRILTHPQWTSSYCLNEKIDWIKKHLPFFDLNHVIMTRLKGEVAKENRVLLDDNPEHLKKWEAEGGIGVSYAKIKYSENWQGYKVKDFNEFYELINKLNTKQ
jgi:5'(3')-deoxyribonucleotidase